MWRYKDQLTSALTLAIVFAASLLLPDRTTAQAPPPGFDKINHVIWIIQENRSFDNYFGTYPGADGIPPGTCLAKLPSDRAEWPESRGRDFQVCSYPTVDGPEPRNPADLVERLTERFQALRRGVGIGDPRVLEHPQEELPIFFFAPPCAD